MEEAARLDILNPAQPPYCESCFGTGLSKKKKLCRACNGSGLKDPTATKKRVKQVAAGVGIAVAVLVCNIV
jgi:DnaJ-class molecular chaperone